MPLVYVDLVELLTLGFLLLFGFFFGGMALLYFLTPGPARNILKGKWLKRGKRSYVDILNDDNVTDIQVGRPKLWGIKVGKKHFLVPRGGKNALVDRRTILSGTGMPYYKVSTRSGLSSSPDFVQLAEEICGFEVNIEPKSVEDQKPEYCLNPKCVAENPKPKIKAVKNSGVLKHWICEFCQNIYTPVTLLNQHVMEHIAQESYDPVLIQGIEQDAKEEARAEKPAWFIWGIILFVPYVLSLVAMVMFTQ